MAGTVVKSLGLCVATVAAIGATVGVGALLPNCPTDAVTALATASGSAVGGLAGNTPTKLCEILLWDTA